MAGCKPEYFPVVVAAVKAVLQEEFNVAGVSSTTGGGAPVIIVNGPLAERLGINGDSGCFGPGYRANASIGRALRLVIRNLGGLIPGEMDKATLATPGRYSFCFSENEERSPWEPRHVELGFDPSASIVTVVGIRGVYGVMETTVATGDRGLEDHGRNYDSGGGLQLLPDWDWKPNRRGGVPRARSRHILLGAFQKRRALVYPSERTHAAAPTQGCCPLRQP